MPGPLAAAIEMHQAGRLAEAAQAYQELLTQRRDDADALHLLGVLRHQQGDHTLAVELIGRAVAYRPNTVAFHANLAEAYRALGQCERAVGCCRTALRLWPDYPEALCNLGLALQGLGRYTEAVEHLRRAVQLRPDSSSAHNSLGLALRDLKQFDEALEHFHRAVELTPDFAPARTNLGQMLLDLGRPQEGLSHCQEAVRLQPDSAALHHNLGNVWRALRQFVDARAAYLEALRLDPDLARSHAHLGLVLQQEGELDDALTWLKQAVELDPDEALLWQYLAELYAEREESAEAVPCWRRVLALEPEHAVAHSGLGWALQDEGRLAEAEAHYRTALQLQPDLAVALLRLGSLQEELGELAEAEASFRDALRLQPAYALPHARLGTLLRGRLPESEQQALEQRLADPDLGTGPRARLLFGLAHVLDARAEYGRAAECLRQANALSLEQARQRKQEYLPAEHEAFVDRLIASFSPEFFARVVSGGLDTDQPVFVFGLPRSGTTLMEQILASHAQIHGAGELRLTRQSFEALPQVLGRSEPPLETVGRLDAAAIRQVAQLHAQRLTELAGTKAARIVDKMPDNYVYLGLLAALFPRATFIHCRRDLRDVAVSCWLTDFRSIPWANDPQHLATRCGQYRRIMEHWQAVLPVPVHVVDYEGTVEDLEGVARKLVAACGLDWDPACLEFHRTRRPVRTASVTQVRQPVYRHAVGRWKNYEGELAELFAALPLEQPRSRSSHREEATVG